MRAGLFANIVALIIFSSGALQGCASLPPLEGRVASAAYTEADTAGTLIGKAILPSIANHPGLSGVNVLIDGRDAFAARVMMADHAERSLDVQYYIWRNDTTGTLLFAALRAAAERGVRVRLLLDDHNSSGLDPTLAVLDAHPNLEVRLFNPFPMRSMRLLGFMTDFNRLNRRMHNKSFTVDGLATIVGGRNIGDEYFDATGDVLFSDVDILAVGPVVKEVGSDFDRYWNSASAYPAASLLPAPAQSDFAQFAARSASTAAAPQAQAYMKAIRTSPFVGDMDKRTVPLEWAPVRLVSDDPAKALRKAKEEATVAHNLPGMLGEPLRTVDLVSPYFVPGPKWTARLGQLATKGVKVRILTNSLEATDVAAVHAGYAKWRKDLLGAGVTLYELKRVWPHEGAPKAAGSGSGIGGSSASSLHAKTMAVDQERVFVGSFNFDPRSVDLNTEMGFVIESRTLASMVGSVLDARMPTRAYEVKLSPEGRLYWLEGGPDGARIRHDSEPGASYWRRGMVEFMSLLPIDSHL